MIVVEKFKNEYFNEYFREKEIPVYRMGFDDMNRTYKLKSLKV